MFLKISYHQCLILISESTGEKIFVDTTEAQNYTTGDEYSSTHTQYFTQGIASASIYDFYVKLVAPIMDSYNSEVMESDEVYVTCYTNPKQLTGMLIQKWD